MSIGGALELIQSFNNPKIIDAPDSSLQEGKLHSRWKLLTILRDFIQLPKFIIEMEDGGSMSIGGALELIQSFNNPKIIDAPDSSLQGGKLLSRWKFLTILRDFIQLPKLFIEMEDKLFSSTFKIIM